MKNENKVVFLSHPISNETIGYGGKKDFHSRAVLSMENGDSCNQSEWSFNNHVGTHIDAPFHFSTTGKTLDQFPASFWIFNHPQLIDLPTDPSVVIDYGPWMESILQETDLLLLRTGFESHRNSENFWAHNPGLSPELGLWLRQNRPTIRVIGLDLMSVTSYDHRALGKKAHNAFLHEAHPGNPLLVIEDMHLAELVSSPKRVTVSPLIVKNADGSPVTVIAEL